MKIEDFQALNMPEKMIITQHGRKRFVERNIFISDIRSVIETGEIIEDYPDDYPFPSCLIVGTSKGRKLHLVASIGGGMIYIITTYAPNPDKWDADFKKSRGTLT